MQDASSCSLITTTVLGTCFSQGSGVRGQESGVRDEKQRKLKRFHPEYQISYVVTLTEVVSSNFWVAVDLRFSFESLMTVVLARAG